MKLSNVAMGALAANTVAGQDVSSCQTYGGSAHPLTITGAGTYDGTFAPTSRPPAYTVCGPVTGTQPSPVSSRSTGTPLYSGLSYNPDSSLNSYLTGSLGLPNGKSGTAASPLASTTFSATTPANQPVTTVFVTKGAASGNLPKVAAVLAAAGAAGVMAL